MIQTIAIHLPQFHPFPENDQWWGKGFTEWTNVTKARPLFEGHYQPHLPADLGFYDLRLEETRVAQAALAQEYGINGFCYYHYWFNGKRLMNRPLDDMIKTKTPNFPFMVCWANENWTRAWDGLEREVLIQQTYSDEDDIEHITFLCKHFFSDERYIKIDNKPFFVIYRPSLFPDIKKTVATMRRVAKEFGFNDLYIGYMKSFSFAESSVNSVFDCAIEFPPVGSVMPERVKGSILTRLLNVLNIRKSLYHYHSIYSYPKLVEQMLLREHLDDNVFPGITPMWDNSARRKINTFILKDSNPQDYQKWLQHLVDLYDSSSASSKFIFINAWNEWAEGNHLEPCQKWGRQYLEATKTVLDKMKSPYNFTGG